jgi:hypothetical protein
MLMTPTISSAQVKVQIVDPDVDSSTLEKDYEVSRKSTQADSIPSKEARDEIFVNIKSIKKWDELKKDIFFMDLKSKSISELSAKYPEFSQSDLKSLKAKRD